MMDQKAWSFPNKTTRITVFIFSLFFMYVFYKKATIINEKFLVFDLDESRIEFILVFIVHLLCHVWML